MVVQEVHYSLSSMVYQDCQRDGEDDVGGVEEGVLRSHHDDASSLEGVDHASWVDKEEGDLDKGHYRNGDTDCVLRLLSSFDDRGKDSGY